MTRQEAEQYLKCHPEVREVIRSILMTNLSELKHLKSWWPFPQPFRRRKENALRYRSGLHFPWRVEMAERNGRWRVVNTNREVVLELIINDRYIAERIVRACNDDEEVPKNRARLAWYWGKDRIK